MVYCNVHILRWEFQNHQPLNKVNTGIPLSLWLANFYLKVYMHPTPLIPPPGAHNHTIHQCFRGRRFTANFIFWDGSSRAINHWIRWTQACHCHSDRPSLISGLFAPTTPHTYLGLHTHTIYQCFIVRWFTANFLFWDGSSRTINHFKSWTQAYHCHSD